MKMGEDAASEKETGENEPSSHENVLSKWKKCGGGITFLCAEAQGSAS